VPLRDEKIGDFLDRLADRVPAPGGGAAAAVHAALGAALLGMVSRYSMGERYAGQEETIGRVTAEADELRDIALRLAEADEAAFGAVAQAYGLPRSTEEDRVTRSAAIARALVDAAWPQAKLISIAGMVVDLAGVLADIGNRSLLSDVGAAAEAARAAAATARTSIEINLAGITDEQASLEMISETGKAEEVITRAEKLAAAVREQIRA
jgi:methenyltetrahydrofolate cyclohydrolase